MAKQTFTSGQTLTAAQMTTLQANDFNWSVSTQTANYTLVAADKGTREVMNMSSAGTVTVPNATFDAGDIVWVHSIGSGTITLTAGTGMTLNSSAGTAPTLAQWEGGVVYFTSASSSIFFRGGGVAPANFSDAATGTYSSGGINYKYLTFTASGTLTITRAGFADILVVGGGGGGGTGVSGGGGGAGGHLSITNAYLPSGALTVTVGAGGAAGAGGSNYRPSSGNAGTTSRLGDYYGVGGAPATGMFYDASGGNPQRFAYPGGSGGGGLADGGSGNSGGSGTSGQGNAGGASTASAGGGGGGANAAGGAASGGNAGNGGAGISTSLDNAATTRAGGGGGGAYLGSAGTGGSGGGGAGSANTTAATSGTVNTGGGGGGGGFVNSSPFTTGNGGAGGSGIVIVRVKV